MAWLSENANLIAAAANIGLLAVWILYAQLFYKRYHRQRRPRLIVDQMSARGPESVCTLTNLSAEPVYLECVLAVAITEDGEFSCPVTEQEPITTSEQSRLSIVAKMRQGPIGVGELVTLGKLDDLARRALGGVDAPDGSLQALKWIDIRVVATMSSEDSPIGASKRFNVGFGDGAFARSTTLGTAQLYSRRDQRRVRAWIESV